MAEINNDIKRMEELLALAQQLNWMSEDASDIINRIIHLLEMLECNIYQNRELLEAYERVYRTFLDLLETNEKLITVIDSYMKPREAADSEIRSITDADISKIGSSEEKRYYCQACGAPVPKGVIFCSKCEHILTYDTSENTKLNPADADSIPGVIQAGSPGPSMCGSPGPVIYGGPEPSVCDSPGPVIYGSPGSPVYSSSDSFFRSIPRPQISKVYFSAVAPKVFIKDEYTMIHLVMYEKAFRSIVNEITADYETDVKETRSGMMKVTEEARVRVALSSPDIEIEDCEEEKIWQGEYLVFGFAVELPGNYAKKQILFTAAVYINDIIATKLKFIVKCSSWRKQKITADREDVLSAFVSYASQDRNRVARIIQGMRKARPDMDIFFDIENLRSGESWQNTLQTEIDRRDILFLCWSHFAKQSKWVDTEWRYAFNQKGADGIEPIPLESPSVCPPPEELSKKHFNDKMLFIINGGNTEV